MNVATQRQEIHMLLLALLEMILSFCDNSIMDPYDNDYYKFTRWIGNINAQANKNQTSKFWVDILHFLGAYVGINMKNCATLP